MSHDHDHDHGHRAPVTPRHVTTGELDTPLLAYPDAIAMVIAAFDPLPPVEVALDDCLGLVLAADVVATDDIPSFDNSAMDGYAIRSADTATDGATLTVTGSVGEGTAAKIMTGHPIPDGADAVVQWERTTDRGDGTVRVDGVVDRGASIRPSGEDVRDGSTVLTAGTRLGAVEVGMLAALGRPTVPVHPAPRVGVLSTGDELVGVDEPVGRGRIRDANGPLISATCRALGAVISETLRATDDPEQIADALRRLAASSDLIVTSGGASVGERDWLRHVLETEGELDFWRVALRPGKPVALGSVAGCPVIVLPGNPGSVVACSHVFVARAVRRLAGRDPEPDTFTGALSEAIVGDQRRTVVHPVTIDGDVVTPAVVRSSQVLSNALGYDGWVITPPGGLDAGARVKVELPR